MAGRQDGQDKVQGNKFEPKVETRRDMALSLMGLLGASALLKGCAMPEGDAVGDKAENVGVAMSEASGVAGRVFWFDTYDELRLLIGGTGNNGAIVAVRRDPREGSFFVWTPDTTTAHDNVMTFAVPNGVRVGAWKRVYSGALNVLWFGATGDGSTPDTSAIQQAVNYALIKGDELYFPAGKYVIEDTINIGNPIMSASTMQTIFTRDRQLAEVLPPDPPGWNDLPIWLIKANVLANRQFQPISLTFAPNAYILAHVIAPTPKAAISYNLENINGTGSIRGLNVIGPYMFHTPAGPPVVATNVIGLFTWLGCSQIDKATFWNLAFGIATMKSYWCSVRDVTVFHCLDAMNIAEGNAMFMSNLTFIECQRGLVFDGASAKIMNINTEQVDYDLWIFAADSCTFGPGYLEEGRVGNDAPPAFAFITAGAPGVPSNSVTHCIYDGLRMSGQTNKKRGIDLERNFDVTFLNVRTYSRSIETGENQNGSYGTLINCDFDVVGAGWTSLSARCRFGSTAYLGVNGLMLMGTVGYPLNGIGVPPLNSGETFTYDLLLDDSDCDCTVLQRLPFEVGKYTAVVQMQTYDPAPSQAFKAVLRLWATVVSRTHIQIHVTNPLAQSVPTWSLTGTVTIQAFA